MRTKITVPAAGMSSADWDGVDPDIRERSFWTAREGCYARVQGFRDRCQGIVDGNLSEADALREVRAMLRATGYQPEPGTEGTIQDLNSDSRQRLILDTNVAMVRERAYRDSMLGSLAYPAQRLVRIRYSRQPRDWDARWREAAAAVNYEGVATDGSHIALLTSPIWRKLSRFDLDYPPFDFNSGMGVDPVDYEEARRHGLTIPEATLEGADGESLNASLEASIARMDGDLQQAFVNALEDCVEVEGDRVYYTDPNGTRPVHWSEAGKVICGQRPPVIPDTQARAMVKFVEDQRQFDRAQRGVQGYATQEEWDALYNAVTRIQPTDVKESGTLYRGMSIPPMMLTGSCPASGATATRRSPPRWWTAGRARRRRRSGLRVAANRATSGSSWSTRTTGPATASTPSSAPSRSKGVLSTRPTNIPTPMSRKSCSCRPRATRSTKSSGGGTAHPLTSMSASSNNRSALAALAPVLAAVAMTISRPVRTAPAGHMLAALNSPALILRQLCPSQLARCGRILLSRSAGSAQVLQPQRHLALADLAVHSAHVPLMPQPSTLVNS